MKHCRYVGMFFEARAGVMVDKAYDENKNALAKAKEEEAR